MGVYPVVVLLPPLRGITSFVKALARRLARNRYGVLVPDLTRGRHPGSGAPVDDLLAAYQGVPDRRALADIDDAVAFAFNDPASWARDGKIGCDRDRRRRTLRNQLRSPSKAPGGGAVRCLRAARR